MVIFVTAHDHFAVEAFDCDAVDYVLKPVAQDRLERAVERALSRQAALADPALPRRPPACGCPAHDDATASAAQWIEEFWVPHRSELVRVAAGDIDRIDAERDYVRLHVGQRSYLMLHTIQRLEDRLDRRTSFACTAPPSYGGTASWGCVTMAWAWSAELADGTMLRIGRTYLAKAKAMAGR
jgi:two-component system response regulator AlgR